MFDLLKENIWLVNLISAMVLPISYLLFKSVAGSMSLSKLNMISFIFYVFLFLMSYIGSILIVNNLDDHYLINKLKDDYSRIFGWSAVMYTMIALPLGMMIGKFLLTFKSTAKVFYLYKEKPIVPLISHKDSYLRYGIYFLSLLSISAVIYTLVYTPQIPIFNFFLGAGSDTLMAQRISSEREFMGIEYIKNILGILLMPVLSLVSFGYYKMTKSKLDKWWFIIMLLFTVIILTYDLQKSPLVTYILGMVMVMVLISSGKRKINVTKYLVFAGITLVILYFSISKPSDDTAIITHNRGIVGRIFLTSTAGLYHSFDIYPEQRDHQGFSSLSVYISKFMELKHEERSAREIMEILNPKGIEDGTAGVINSLFVGEAWANFGLIGVLLSPFYVGFLIGLLYHFLLLTKKTPFYLGIYGYFSYRAGIIGGFNNYIYSAAVIILLAIVLFTLITARNLYLYRQISFVEPKS